MFYVVHIYINYIQILLLFLIPYYIDIATKAKKLKPITTNSIISMLFNLIISIVFCLFRNSIYLVVE